MRRYGCVAAVAVALLAVWETRMAHAGAPRVDGRFVNAAGPLDRRSLEFVPFLARRIWTSLGAPPDGARRVPYDRAALMHNPSVTWIGHSTFLVRMDGVTFLTDPIFSERASPVPFAGPRRAVPPGVPLEELPPVDFVTLSHDHYDHTDLPSVRALAARGATFVVPLGLGELVESAGGRAIELDWWQTADLGRVRVHCVPAQHASGRSLTDVRTRLWAGWVVEGPTRRFYHAGDTGYFPGFREIGERFGSIDLAAIPIGAYAPERLMRPVHLNPEEAVQAGLDVRATRIVGMHFGTFQLTDEPMGEPPWRFHSAAYKAGLGAERAWTLSVGESRRW